MKFRFSTVSEFRQCPYKYFLGQHFETIPNFNAKHPLIVGSALHKGIEDGFDAGKKEYVSSFHEFTNEHENELIKLEYWVKEIKKILPPGHHEVFMENDFYHGTIDFIDENGNMYDFKYSNNVDGYLKSDQLHVYKYFYEKITGNKINKLFYIFIPKTFIRQKKSETLIQFRIRLINVLKGQDIKVIEIKCDSKRIVDFYKTMEEMKLTKNYPRRENKFCDWCEFYDYCQKGDDTLILPKNERRKIEHIKKKTLWLYGAPFSGKTTFANKFPDPLILNTDGNIKFVDAPYIPIKDEVEMVGRLKKKTLSWQKFKDVLDELEKNENEFKTIVVDLLEDLYLACRIYMYDKLGIEHESDDSFRAWDKVRTEFLSTMKRFFNLDYDNLIVISHIDTSSDITKRSGDKYTRVAPSLQPKVADKIAGMVDIVARIYSDNGNRKLSFENDEIIFGGGRIKLEKEEIPLDYNEFVKIYGGE